MNERTLQLPREGEKIGSGIILSLISVGGSARVYKTWIDTLEMHRAVKVMNPDADQEIRARFATEARITSKLAHPNIVQVHNFGETPSGLPYIEMELISGQTLETLLRLREKLPVPVALAVVMGVLEAVNYAHTANFTLYDQSQRGLMHRDIKPANVIFSGGVPKLMDFGIARPVAISLHTMSGNMPGTMAYMAPESCSGGDSDFRSDIYQIGLLLYECINGQMAYPQRDLMPLMEAIRTGNRKPLNASGKVASIVKKCLELDPEKRYQTAEECLKDIRSLYMTMSQNMAPETQILAFLQGGKLSTSSVDIQNEKIGGNSKALKITTISAVCTALVFAGLVAFKLAMPEQFEQYLGALKGNAAPPAQEEILEEMLPQEFAMPKEEAEVIEEPTPVPVVVEPPAPIAQPAPKPQQQTAQTQSAQNRRPAQTAKQPAPAPAKTTVSSGELSTDDALFFIEGGNSLLSQGRAQEALASFQQAQKMQSEKMPRQARVRQSSYGAAKASTILYKQGNLPRANYEAAWIAVHKAFPEGSTEYNEAISHLSE